MKTEELFAEHLKCLVAEYSEALQAAKLAEHSVLVHSGMSHDHYADDHAMPFRAWGHYLRWLPVDRPDQLVLIRPGKTPVFFAVIPQDFWHDQHVDMPLWWAKEFEIVILSDLSQLARELRPRLDTHEKLVFLGEGIALAESLDIAPQAINPPRLLSQLDFRRAFKTAYEVHRVANANALALTGHQAAHDAFLDGSDEYDIHMAYLRACRALDQDLPYPSIVAVNEHAATLHYQHKQRRSSADQSHNRVLLIDAGCRSAGYCSDITRTWVRPDCHPEFKALLAGVQSLQREVIEAIKPGMNYIDLHVHSHRLLARLLVDTGVCIGTAEEVFETGLTTTFLPHGLGHLLGLQVHDVGGRMTAPDGTIATPPPQFPALRTTRTIQNNMVFTIEPGVYFIPMLLDKARAGDHVGLVQWKLVDELLPYGGIRIEDNIWINNGQPHNLTMRPLPD
ncbi:Xaa-Pro dipeptidase [Pseudohongiella sp. O18]|uniref:Xaa-Pro dipeptidase n=1 Tax=Pseudohongiella sp. O18 TaxID=2904248 RepID=UPI001F31725D|nr:Xaa-Pro dipeptidase [Pseudohongiella sp. O18]